MDINKPQILQSSIGSIKNEELLNEKKIHIARISVFLLVFIMASVARLSFGASLNMRFFLISTLSISCVCLGLFLWHKTKTKKYSSAIKYYLVTLDIVFVSILVLIVRFTMSQSIYGITTDIPAFLALFFINAMSGLRFDFKLSLYCAGASAIILIGFTSLDYHSKIITHPYLIMFSVFKGIILLGIALVSGFIGKTAKKLIIHNYKEQEEKNYVKNIFGKYVTPEIRDKILDGRIPLNGERVEATVLFADLRDFTPFVEKNDPEEVIKSLRAYFTAMQKVIRKHQGLVLQYVGDEIEAAFGVPLPYHAHANEAVMAAVEMKKSLEEFNSGRVEEGKIPFRHGIGIHTGELLAGNTGSEDQPSYALIGDTVNLASRLQSLNKKFGTEIIISEATRKRLDDSFRLKELPATKIKGKSGTETLFAIDDLTATK